MVKERANASGVRKARLRSGRRLPLAPVAFGPVTAFGGIGPRLLAGFDSLAKRLGLLQMARRLHAATVAIGFGQFLVRSMTLRICLAVQVGRLGR